MIDKEQLINYLTSKPYDDEWEGDEWLLDEYFARQIVNRIIQYLEEQK